MAPKKKQSNFSIALDQLINGTENAPVEEAAPVVQPEPPVVKPEPVVVRPTPVVKPEPVVKPAPAPAVEKKEEKALPVDSSAAQVTLIQADTIITGSIMSKNALRLLGTVEGDVSTTSELNLSGDITGKVVAKSINMLDGVIEGDVKCGGNLNMDSDSLVLGDITANSMVLDGRVKGNLTVNEHLKLNAHSIIAGDITANTIQMDNGASVAGKVTIVSETKKVDDTMFARRKKG